jgi:hypothetical protein
MKRHRRWIWFFALLALLTVTAIVLEVGYNLWQQLRPGQLAAARQLWQEKGPRHYHLDYAIRRPDEAEQRYTVTVREGKVESVVASNGRPLQSGEYPFESMDAFFDRVEEHLQRDTEPGAPRVFATAAFDRSNGHILRYVRSVRNPRERMEILVRLRPAPPQPGG